MTTLYWDIETIPSQLPGIREELAKSIDVPGNISKAETVAAWHADKKPVLIEEAYLKTSFDGGVGQVVCIGLAIDDHPPVSFEVSDFSRESECNIIDDLFEVIIKAGPVQYVGHNVIGFDFPFLWKRCMVLGIKPPASFPRNPKPWGDTVVDTMLLWDATPRPGGSMDRICRLLGIPGKGDMDGSKVWPMAQTGRWGEIAAYCRDDVDRTRMMHKRMTFS